VRFLTLRRRSKVKCGEITVLMPMRRRKMKCGEITHAEEEA